MYVVDGLYGNPFALASVEAWTPPAQDSPTTDNNNNNNSSCSNMAFHVLRLWMYSAP